MENNELIKNIVSKALSESDGLTTNLKDLLAGCLSDVIGDTIALQEKAGGAVQALTSVFGPGPVTSSQDAVTDTVLATFDTVVKPKLSLSPGIASAIRALLPDLTKKCMNALNR